MIFTSNPSSKQNVSISATALAGSSKEPSKVSVLEFSWEGIEFEIPLLLFCTVLVPNGKNRNKIKLDQKIIF